MRDARRFRMAYGCDIAWLAFVMLLFVFLTYRSFSQTVFYVCWVAGFGVFGLFFTAVMLRTKISKTTFLTFVLVNAWILPAIILTPFATDIKHHIKILVISVFYISSSVFFVDILIRSQINFRKMWLTLLIFWVIINGIFLIMFFTGHYVPTRLDFSGVFHDRNVFSITTLIIIVLSISFNAELHQKLAFKLFFNLMIAFCGTMILVSKSVTGFFGLVLVFFILSWRLTFMKKIAIWSFLIILVIGIFSLDNPLKHRLDRVLFAVTGQTKQLWENESAYIRSYLIEKGFELATERPFTGVGLDNAQFHIMWPTKDTGSFLHNTYLDILTSGGFLMFLLYYFPIFFALGWLFMKRKYFKKSTTYLGQMWLCSLLLLSLKVVYDITWTTYFEFAVVFSVTFSIYSTLCLKKELNSGKNFIYSKYS